MPNTDTMEFIRAHADDDVRQLALQMVRFPGVEATFALEQIAGRQKARTKLPAWAAVEDMVYPPHLSMEQCSSEQTARYKGAVARRLLGGYTEVLDGSNAFVDLTGGFGVDFYFMAKALQDLPFFIDFRACYVEQQAHLCEAARHNFARLGMDCAQVTCANGVETLRLMPAAVLIYLDPARRNEHGNKTYAIEDCTPNVLQIEELLVQKAEYVLIKLSPMLDWHKAVNDLKHVVEVHIVSVGNECKELLFVLRRTPANTVQVYCENDGHQFVFPYRVHGSATTAVCAAQPLENKWLYEPNASIMKGGCFAQLCQTYALKALAPNSHLFIADAELPYFPGRGFQITAVSTMNKKELRRMLAGISQANIAVRNFPLSVAELRKRLKLKDGGAHYLFAGTDAVGNHLLLLCRKVL
ncbi:MAG TPA: SAM-dependent methyltransferase [Prevotella sp.]